MAMEPSRGVEKLIILLDYSEGVLARLYHATQFQPGKELANLPSELTKYLLRNVQDPAEDFWQLQSVDQIKTRRLQIADETRFVFNVFLDMLDTASEISTVIKHVTTNILKFDLETNGDVAIRTFDLLSNFSKMVLLSARISEVARLAVMLHSVCAQDQTHSLPLSNSLSLSFCLISMHNVHRVHFHEESLIYIF